MSATPLDVREAARRVEQYERDKKLAAQLPALEEQSRIEAEKERGRQAAAAAEANVNSLLPMFKSHRTRYHQAVAEWLAVSDDLIEAGRELRELYLELNGQYRQMIAAGFVASEGPVKDGFDAKDRELRFGGQVQEALANDGVSLAYPPTEGVHRRLLDALGPSAPVRATSPPKEGARFRVVGADGSVRTE